MKTLRPCREKQAANWTLLQKFRRPVTDGIEVIDLLLSDIVNKSVQALAETLITGSALSEIKCRLGPQEFDLWGKEHIKDTTVSVDTLLKLHKLQQRWAQSGKSDREIAYKMLGLLMLADSKSERATHI